MKALTDLLERGVDDGAFPGAAFAVGNNHGTWCGFVGRQTYACDAQGIGPETLWDMASVTKVAATTPAAMLLVDDGCLDLEASVSTILPEFSGGWRDSVKVRNLLLHDSGLPEYADVTGLVDRRQVWAHLCALDAKYEPGKDSAYSCLGFVTLQHVIERVARRPIDELLRDRLWQPLGLGRTLYRPGEELRGVCAPTERLPAWQKALEDRRGFRRVQDSYVQGEVHDPVACVMGGVSGNAGLFSCPEDLAVYLRTILNGGVHAGKRVFAEETVLSWTRAWSPASSRGLGWDTKAPEGSSAGSRFSADTFGHTGYTGTSVFVDPTNRLFAALLSNRVHPTSENLKIADIRPAFHDAAFKFLT